MARETADVILAELDKAVAGGLRPGELCYMGEYSNYGGGGSQPFFAAALGPLLVDGARPLAHVLAQPGVDANARFDVYNYPFVYSYTPLLALAALATMADRAGQAADMGAGVRALLAAGARPDAKADIVCNAGGYPNVQTPYEGPRYGRTVLAVLTTTKSNSAEGVYVTGASGISVLKALLAGGAEADPVDGAGVKLSAHPELSPEAKAVLEAHAQQAGGSSCFGACFGRA